LGSIYTNCANHRRRNRHRGVGFGTKRADWREIKLIQRIHYQRVGYPAYHKRRIAPKDRADGCGAGADAGGAGVKVGSREQAIEAGMKFVGESPVRIVDRATSLPTGWRNADDTRIFREPAPKGYAGGREGANLEIWTKNSSGAREQVVNTHLVW